MSTSLREFPSSIRAIDIGDVDWDSFDEPTPLVVKGAMTRAMRKWTEKWLLQRFGSGRCQVTLDSRVAFRAFKKQVPLADYLDGLAKPRVSRQPPQYVFHEQQDFEGAADLLEDLDVPSSALRLGEVKAYRLFVGPALSGTLPHFHGPAVNALARGRKRWAVYRGANWAETIRLRDASYRDYPSGSQAKEWFTRECHKLRRRNLQLWEFAQEAGELVYIPAKFMHAVLNLEPVVGFSIEFFPAQPLEPRRPIRSMWMRRPMRLRSWGLR